MEASIVITDVLLMPNPVEAGKPYRISATIKDRIPVLGDDVCRIVDDDGLYIESPKVLVCLADDTGFLADNDDKLIETEE